MIPLKLLLLLVTCAGAEKLMNIKGKIALVTSGVQGIGYATIEALLRAGIRGVTIVDFNATKGKTAAKALNAKYGYGRVIFLPADVTNEIQFEDAFKIALQHWKGLDIVVNNAGVSNENNWMLPINVNIVGVVHGSLLGFKYMSKKSKGGKGGVIINMSSIAALSDEFYFIPVYGASKSFVLGLGRALGNQVYYDYNEVRVVTVCPGTTTYEVAGEEMIKTQISKTLVPNLQDIVGEILANRRFQTPQNAGKGIQKVIEDGSNGSVWVIEDDEPPYEVDFPERKTMRKTNT